MEHKLSQGKLINESSKNIDNAQINNYYLFNSTNIYITNEDYIKLFYNSKNSGLNKNFPLNVIYNKKKPKSTK